MCSVFNYFLGISQNISAFSKNTAGGTFVILSDYSLKMSATLFNPLTPDGKKRSYILKQTFN